MARRGVDGLGVARRGPIAAAVVGGAEVRAALEHLARDADAGLAGVVARLLAPAARIARHAAWLGCVGLVPRGVPVGGPFPDVADHVVEAVAVGWEGRDRRRATVAVGDQVLAWEFALPGVGHMPAARRELVAPGELRAVEAAARGVLPFGLRRQRLAGPRGVGLCVAVGDMDHGVLVKPAN